MLNEQQFFLFGQIQSIQTGGQPNNNTFTNVSVLDLNANPIHKWQKATPVNK